ncbi:TetR/AcrR family transcriptional regulator [Bradyrhizobium sp. STM 3557]|uniref:TetR/AcrR family transcriptional regulator n=1 Tax=Bradyrhizobium sp. STM 3557 TaxID=578920 RepID=UPI00388E7724
MTRQKEAARPRPRRPASASRAAQPKRSARTRGGGEAAPYHHGALREALLKAAETVLRRDGLAGLTLRAVAREAGVSHAAPTHHFGDLTGLLSELAAIGFQRFGAAMQAAIAAAPPAEKGLASARAYVAYAQANPGMYSLMFRHERLDYARPSLHAAAEASFMGLARAVGAAHPGQITDGRLSLDEAGRIVHAWSLVHGYAMLLLDGRLTEMLRRAPAGTTPETLLHAMLKASRPPQPG